MLKFKFSCNLILVFLAMAVSAEPLHLDLEATSQELRNILKDQKFQWQTVDLRKLKFPGTKSNWTAEEVMAIGERLYKWIETENAKRPSDNQLKLSSPGNRRGIPITSPLRYGPAILTQDFEQIVVKLPTAMKDILFSNTPFPIGIPVSDEEFVTHGRLIDRQYQSASRWLLLIKDKQYYTRMQARDIRGYYFLTTEGWDEAALRNWESFAPSEQKRLRSLLVGLCWNTGETPYFCDYVANDIKTGQQAVTYFKNYIGDGKKVYHSFFEIRNARKDIHWRGTGNAEVPFVDPKRQDFRNFLKNNIEDEFKMDQWKLAITFVANGPAPYLEFVTGVTPNVDAVGGNRIRMDSNQSLQEYEIGWIFRHEFGHVLGFPDCYHEFFDPAANEFINYQIDTTDLMCSRAGNFNTRLYNQLRNTYHTP